MTNCYSDTICPLDSKVYDRISLKHQCIMDDLCSPLRLWVIAFSSMSVTLLSKLGHRTKRLLPSLRFTIGEVNIKYVIFYLKTTYFVSYFYIDLITEYKFILIHFILIEIDQQTRNVAVFHLHK